MWSAVLFGIMSMYMAFFSTMQEMAQVKFEMLPKEYLQLMGVEDISQMGNYVTFFWHDIQYFDYHHVYLCSDFQYEFDSERRKKQNH